MVCAGAPASGHGKYQSNIGRIDFLVAGYAHRPAQAARAQRLAEGRAQAVASIGQHGAEAQAGGVQAVDLLDGNLRLAARDLEFSRHASAPHPLGICAPTLGQEQPQANHDRHG